MPQEEYLRIPVLGIELRQTATAPKTHVDIHPFVFAKLLTALSLKSDGYIDIIKHTDAPVVENVL